MFSLFWIGFITAKARYASFNVYNAFDNQDSMLSIDSHQLDDFDDVWQSNDIWDTYNKYTVYRPVQYEMKCSSYGSNQDSFCICKHPTSKRLHQCRNNQPKSAREYFTRNDLLYNAYNAYNYYDSYEMGIEGIIAKYKVVTHESTAVKEIMAKFGGFHWTQPISYAAPKKSKDHMTMQQDSLCLMIWALKNNKLGKNANAVLEAYTKTTSRGDSEKLLTGKLAGIGGFAGTEIMSEIPKNLNFYYDNPGDGNTASTVYTFTEVHNNYYGKIKKLASSREWAALLAKDEEVVNEVKKLGLTTEKKIGWPKMTFYDVTIADIFDTSKPQYYGNWKLKQPNTAVDCHFV